MNNKTNLDQPVLGDVLNDGLLENSFLALGFSEQHLLKLARWSMPFGKYAGRRLIDLPEEYLFWFEKKGFPEGELGELMKFCLDLKIEGLDGLIRPLKIPDE